MFNEIDIKQITKHGITPERIEEQLQRFREGFPYLNISRSAVVGDGIVRLTDSETTSWSERFRQMRNKKKIVKFVPASGAATRMFKALFEFLNSGAMTPTIETLMAGIDRFAFSEQLKQYTKGSPDPKTNVAAIVGPGLNYGSSPKALILFHRYADHNRTALEEHLAEGAMYARSASNETAIHFTVSPEHRPAFEQLVARVQPYFSSLFGTEYRITYSQQKGSTDTIAVNPDNTPFRDAAGRLLFRPAGHGALIENLNEIDADLIFIKNIDNVVPDRLKPDTVLYKEALAGILLSLQQKCFGYLEKLENDPDTSLTEIESFVNHELHKKLPDTYATLPAEKQRALLIDLLDRPIRVCGMVKNEGEPGGGPVWAIDPDGSESLQIAESSQIAPDKQEIMAAGTHFNPVDLVCATKNYKGEKFNLLQYTDPQTGFISSKSQQGRPLKALELPGLWNGAMARWNTLFVEVPITTFNPVKTVNDLLKPQHQNE